MTGAPKPAGIRIAGRLARGLLALAAAGLTASCGREPERTPSAWDVSLADTFSVMTYNLGRYALDDRDDDGQKNDPKPQGERDAVISVILKARPDVLAVQEIGNPAVFEEFRYEIKRAGLAYDHAEYLQRGQSENNLAVLSRFPIVARNPHTDDLYSMGEARIPVLRGFLDVEIEVPGGYRFRLMNVHLKSKVFHPLGQTEMRRNEARLLNRHARRILKENPGVNLLIVGDLNDTSRSAALREITGDRQQHLADLRPEDEVGDVWTRFDAGLDQYDRMDYVLASPGMRNEWEQNLSRVVRDRLTGAASDHRPVLAVFRRTEEAGPGWKPDREDR
jgi:endonuclease/exonuclease/phosphatase family metal-dependent hydrolase